MFEEEKKTSEQARISNDRISIELKFYKLLDFLKESTLYLHSPPKMSDFFMMTWERKKTREIVEFQEIFEKKNFFWVKNGQYSKKLKFALFRYISVVRKKAENF